jgi:N-acetylmuramoyl-L-alanine amidase
MKFAIVVGHSERKQGAYGNAGITEFKFNTQLAKDIKLKLDELGIKSKIFFRKNYGSYTEKMKDLHRRIDKYGAGVSISLHFNASATNAKGHEILYCSSGGKKIAEILDKEFDKLGNRDRNIKKRTKRQRGGGFLCRGRSKCVIAEPFFASEQKNFVKHTQAYTKLVEAYTNAIQEIEKTYTFS